MCEKKRGEGGISEGGFSNDACLWMWMAQVSVSIHASECESERVRLEVEAYPKNKVLADRSKETGASMAREIRRGLAVSFREVCRRKLGIFC